METRSAVAVLSPPRHEQDRELPLTDEDRGGEEAGSEEVPPRSWEFPSCPGWKRHPIRSMLWLVAFGWAIVCETIMLAILAAIPIVNVWALGYLLEKQSRTSTEGLSRGIRTGLRWAPRLVGTLCGLALFLVPLWFLGGLRGDAGLIAPSGDAERALRNVLFIARVVVIVHVSLTLLRGGRFRSFFRPVKNIRWSFAGRPAVQGEAWSEIPLHVRRRLWLGFGGSLGALLCLAVPAVLYQTPRTENAGAILATVVGGLLLVPVLCWLPLLQNQFAISGHLWAFADWKSVRRTFRRAPISLATTLCLGFTLALPFYIAKAFKFADGALWLPVLVWVVTIVPTRLAIGWAYGRAMRAEQDAWFGVIWLGRLLVVAFVVAYALIVYTTQYVGVTGRGMVLDQHLFLPPLPW